MGPVICEWLLSLPECHKMTWTPEWLAKFFLSDKNTADKALDLHLDDCTIYAAKTRAVYFASNDLGKGTIIAFFVCFFSLSHCNIS